MGKIYLVRHAQASFGMDNYDQLSEKGRQQSALLPQFFEQAIPNGIEALYTGELERQKETASIGFPEMICRILPGLNEYDHINLLQVYKPEWVDRNKIISYILSQPDPKKAMQREFENGMNKWIQETENADYTEKWPDFQRRCINTLEKITEQSKAVGHKEVAAVTSGGFIAAVVGHVLGLSPEKYLEMNWVIANASVTGLLFNDEKISLSFLNNYQYLPKGMVTFR